MDDFYAPIGPRMKMVGGPELQPFSRPLGAKMMRGLLGGLSLFLVPLLYVAIFRARRKHATTVGEWDNYNLGDQFID